MRRAEFDLSPATIALATVVEGVRVDQLGLPTPCEQSTVGALLAHVDGLTRVFAAAAREDRPAGGDASPGPGVDDVTPGWRDRVREQLTDLARAWDEASAWQGMTRAGGVDLPRDLAGLIVTDELIVHGWDLATATDQPFDAAPALVEAALRFVEPSVAQAPRGTPGLFGPPVAVPDDALPLERLLCLTGRDPAWRPARLHAGD